MTLPYSFLSEILKSEFIWKKKTLTENFGVTQPGLDRQLKDFLFT